MEKREPSFTADGNVHWYSNNRKQYGVSLKKLKIHTILFSNLSSEYLTKKIKNTYSQRYMHPYVHCSIIHGGQDIEIVKVSFSKWLDKEDMAHFYCGILLSDKKIWNMAFYDNVDGSWEY